MSNTNQIVMSAFKQGLVVPAFNIPYLPMMEPVIQAVVDSDAFALIETARLEWIKFQAGGLEDVIREFERWQHPDYVRLHLDHVPVLDEDNQSVDFIKIIRESLDLGYGSVMIDGSRLSLEENIIATRQVVELAHRAGVPCEAELGAVLGHEAGPLPPYEELFESGRGFTNEKDAALFAKETGCDWLSVAVGNIHGAISGVAKEKKKVEARLNLEHLEKIRKAIDIPLVLHGGSSVSRDHLLRAVKGGIAKVNIGTEIRQAFESEMNSADGMAAAVKAVYERTAWLIQDYFDIGGTRSTLFAGIEEGGAA